LKCLFYEACINEPSLSPVESGFLGPANKRKQMSTTIKSNLNLIRKTHEDVDLKTKLPAHVFSAVLRSLWQ